MTDLIEHLPPSIIVKAAEMKAELENKTHKSTHDGEYSRQVIYRYLQEHGFQASVKQIAVAANMSPFNVSYHLKKLVELGKIHRDPVQGKDGKRVQGITRYRDGHKYPTLTPIPAPPHKPVASEGATLIGKGVALDTIKTQAWPYLQQLEATDAETLGVAVLQLKKFQAYLEGK